MQLKLLHSGAKWYCTAQSSIFRTQFSQLFCILLYMYVVYLIGFICFLHLFLAHLIEIEMRLSVQSAIEMRLSIQSEM